MQPQARRTSPALIRGLMALAIVAFFIGVMANAAQAAVLSPGYYQKVLKDENAYEEAYAELPADDVLAPFSNDLLGGVQVPVGTAVPGLLKAAIAPSALEAATEVAIKDLIEYLKKHKDLELKLDITDFVNGVPGAGILTAGTQIAGAPAVESPISTRSKTRSIASSEACRPKGAFQKRSQPSMFLPASGMKSPA
ncbi:MAG: hypothetical protein R3B97_16590 [Dehalococcoidia bacterium]